VKPVKHDSQGNPIYPMECENCEVTITPNGPPTSSTIDRAWGMAQPHLRGAVSAFVEDINPFANTLQGEQSSIGRGVGHTFALGFGI
jgi:hypothetical protein